MMAFRQYKLIIIATIILTILSIFSYYYLKSEKLEIEVKNAETKIEVEKDKAEVKNIEVKWETIAEEHNKTLGEEHEIKEPTINYDTNTVDFHFLIGRV